jgi:putative endopeptidase
MFSAKMPITLLAMLAMLGSGVASAQTPAPAKGPQVNFGFPIGFSTSKMDPTVSPRRDFNHYVAGRYLAKATVPSDSMRVSSIDALVRGLDRQLQNLIEEAARTSQKASKGSPSQQVGDFYLSGLDEKRLTELGLTPLKAELDAIEAVDKKESLAPLLARLALTTGDQVVVGFSVGTDPQDRTHYVLYSGEGDLGMNRDNYLKPQAQPIRDAYKKYVADLLTLAGSQPDQARTAASKILELETRVARKKLTPVELVDAKKRFRKIAWSEFKQLISNVDIERYLGELGLSPQSQIIVVNYEALKERNAILGEWSLSDTKTLLRWELLKRSADFLSPAFAQPELAFRQVIYGKMDSPPRARHVAGQLPSLMGHPLSRLYVAKYFSPENKRAVEDLVGRIKAEFRARLVRNAWLSPQTRKYALEKIDKCKITVGYPSQWIDYSRVEIRRDDYLGNVLRINRFRAQRELAKLGKPVSEDQFAAAQTLPVVINAAYQADKNCIEIPAAFLQPPFYDAKADVALNFGTMGAVIGHEMTHGFDSTGRQYDANGTAFNWWTPSDNEKFATEAQKIVRQGNKFEILPGLHVNGALAVTENMADVGGVSLGLAALKGYLHDHPQANRKIDGFTPEQRYFLAWGQVWADKAKEGFLRQTTPTDAHPPGIYRLASPAQHEAEFFKAFGIRPGDPMWLDDKDRIKLW